MRAACTRPGTHGGIRSMKASIHAPCRWFSTFCIGSAPLVAEHFIWPGHVAVLATRKSRPEPPSRFGNTSRAPPPSHRTTSGIRPRRRRARLPLGHRRPVPGQHRSEAPRSLRPMASAARAPCGDCCRQDWTRWAGASRTCTPRGQRGLKSHLGTKMPPCALSPCPP